jgi:ABC-type Mn2+/Zn2+ transport system permease subunit
MRFVSRYLSERSQMATLFTSFLTAAAVALAAAFLILGQMITMASEVAHGPLYVIAAGALVGTLTAFVIHEVAEVLPSVMERLHRG